MTASRVTPQEALAVVSDLLHEGRLSTLEQLPELVARQASRLGLNHVVIYLADLREDVLRELTGRGLDAGEGGEQLPVEGSVAGRAFMQTRPLMSPGDQNGQRRHYIPILDGTRRLGVLCADAAEMQWALMPPRAFASDQVVVAAAMEPIYGVGGDAFDYALADDTLHLAVFDAMGHGVSAIRRRRRRRIPDRDTAGHSMQTVRVLAQ